MDNHNIKTNAMLLIIIGGFVLMAVKFLAFFQTSSSAVWSDALESLVNVSAGIVVFFAIKFGSNPADKEHPFGHGKIEYFTAGFEGGMVLLAGISSIYKGVSSFLENVALTNLKAGIFLSAFAGLGNALMGLYLIQKGKKTHSIALEADGKHLLSDTYSSIGLVLGLIVVELTNILWLDGVLAILFGLLIIKMGAELIKKSFDGLMDTSNPEILEKIAQKLTLTQTEERVEMHNLRVMQRGNDYFVNYHITLPWYWTLEQGEEATNKISAEIGEAVGGEVEFSEHIEPCKHVHCALCAFTCAHRKEKLINKFAWNVDNLRRHEK